MIQKIILPQVGESVTEAIIGKWLKSVGDNIDKYDPVVEVITDKVNMEVPAPFSGILKRILVNEGDTVPMGSIIAEMEITVNENQIQSNDLSADENSSTAIQSREIPSDARVGKLIETSNVGPTGGEFQDSSLSTKEESTDNQSLSKAKHPNIINNNYSPIVSRIASEFNIDLKKISGTGTNGRITKRDVLNVVESIQATETFNPSKNNISLESGDYSVKPSPIRELIANHMTKSYKEIPHAWSAVEVDVTNVIAARTINQDQVLVENGVKLTYLPFILREVALTLKKNPLMNSTWQGERILVKGKIHIGIATATKDGLMVPVIKNADLKTVLELCLELNRLVQMARNGTLALHHVQGGTFTINNTGALGSELGGPIINYGQAAIMTTESILRRPRVVIDGNKEKIAVKSVMNLCLSFDHRVVDGADAARFLQDLRIRIQTIEPKILLS